MSVERNENKIFLIGFVLIIIVIFWFLGNPLLSGWRNREKKEENMNTSQEILKAGSILPEELLKKTNDSQRIILIDASDPDAFSRGHIAGSINASIQKIDSDFLVAIGSEKTSEIILLNQGDNLASIAQKVNDLNEGGFPNAKYLRGGITGWREKGYQIVSSGGSGSDSAKVKKISIDDIKKESEKSPEMLQFLDVRDKQSFDAGHIVQAIHIPLSELEKRKREVPSTRKVIVYGSNENESFQAVVVLFDLDFMNVFQLDGDLQKWKAAGGNTESSGQQ